MCIKLDACLSDKLTNLGSPEVYIVVGSAGDDELAAVECVMSNILPKIRSLSAFSFNWGKNVVYNSTGDESEVSIPRVSLTKMSRGRVKPRIVEKHPLLTASFNCLLIFALTVR